MLVSPPEAIQYIHVQYICKFITPQASVITCEYKWLVFLPVWTSNPDYPSSALLKIPACQWHLVSPPAALDRSSELSGLASEARPWSGLTHLILRTHLWHLASSLFCLCPKPPSRRPLGSLLPFKCFTEHICVVLEAFLFITIFLPIVSHWVQM